MLLVIHNLPKNSNVNDVKYMIKTKCGINNVIVDNLVSDVNGKKVTVGLADEGDAAIFVRKINGLYIDNHQIYVEDVRKKQVKDQPYSKPSKVSYPNYSNNYEIQQNTQHSSRFFVSQEQSTQNSSLTNYVNDVSQPWQQHVPQSFGQNCAQGTGETNSLNYNFQQPYYETSFQFNQSSIPSNFEPSEQYFPSNNRSRIGNNSKLDRKSGSINQRQHVSTRYSPTQAFEKTDYDRGSDLGNRSFRSKRNNSSIDDAMHDNRPRSDANERRSRRRSPSPKRQKMGDSYESNNFRNRSFERFSNTSRNDRSGTRDSFPRSTSRGSNNHQYGRTTHSNVMTNKSYSARNSIESRPKTSSFYKPAHISPWQNDINPRKDIPEARSQSRRTSNVNTARSFNKYEVPNKTANFRIPFDRSKGRNDARPRKIPTSKSNNKMDTLNNKDQTWRCQVTSQIAKSITQDQKIPHEINLPKLLSQLKTCVKSRIDMLLGDRLAVPPTEILSLYKNKFPPEEWPSLYNTVLESVKNSGSENWMSEKFADTKVFKNESGRINIKDKQLKTRAPDVDALDKAAAGKVPKYPNADKNMYKQQKKITALEYQGKHSYHLDPPLQKALDDEVDIIIEEFKKGCEYPDDESEKGFCQRMRDNASGPFKEIICLHLKKRLLNIRTSLAVRLFGTPKKMALMEFLFNYGVVSLKKSDTKKMYIAHIDNYENYDKLCALERATIDGVTVTIKPLNLIGPQKSKAIKDVYNSIELLNPDKNIENNTKPDEKVEDKIEIEETSQEDIKHTPIKLEEESKITIVETNIDTKIESESVKEGSVEDKISPVSGLQEMPEIDNSTSNKENLTEEVNKSQDNKESPIISAVVENNIQINEDAKLEIGNEEDHNDNCDTDDVDEDDLEDY